MESCSVNSFVYNGSQCACDPGYFRDPYSLGADCIYFDPRSSDWTSQTGVRYSDTFTRTIFSFNSLKNITQSQALFLEATTLAVGIWLAYCVALRLGPLHEGRSRWFRLRYWLSRLDLFFSTRHWLDEQKIVVKRKTELGGIFSVASLIFFLGLVAALLYQIISKRAVEVQNIRPANAPDIEYFINDVELNITTVSSMSCAQLHGLGTMQTGIPGFIDERTLPLSDFMKYDCHNTSMGPMVRFQCNHCQVTRDNYYIAWHFVDIPNSPAAAVGFQFNVTAKTPGTDEHVSILSGAVKPAINSLDNRPVTLRGRIGNLLEFRLVPRLFRNVHNLRLIQAFFHELIPGSSYTRTRELQASFQNPADGLLNITLRINFLSDYIVEIDTEDLMGPVTFLADLGGLYAISIALFFYILVQCEYRVKRLRYEDHLLHKLEARRLARQRWDKVRTYVTYTWGRDGLDILARVKRKKFGLAENKMKEIHQEQELSDKAISAGYRDKIRQDHGLELKGVETQSKWSRLKQNLLRGQGGMEIKKESLAEENIDPEGRLKGPLHIEHDLEHEPQRIETSDRRGRQHAHVASMKAAKQGKVPPWLIGKESLPTVPDISTDGPMDISAMDSYLRNLYEYNVRLREDFLAAQSILGDVVQRLSPHSDIFRDQFR